MFRIENVATEGFDRAIRAMRREYGGGDTVDSGWNCGDIDAPDEWWSGFVIGPEDKAECLRVIQAGDRSFLRLAVVWAHIEAPAGWWACYSGYFLAFSEVDRCGGYVTKSVMTTYASLRDLVESARPTNDRGRKKHELLCRALAGLPESWLIIPEKEAREWPEHMS